MADLHEALTYLSPVGWSDVPQDDLAHYLTDCLAAGELICNSVPSPDDGTPFASAQPHFDTPNTAKSHRDIHASPARSQPPDPEHEELQSSWGKPLKLKKADNPLNIHLWKMAGKDRHGGWFARKSVHEGIGFDKFRRAMMREFPESMAVTGGPGAGAIRGIAADRLLEHFEVEDKGVLDAYELSAKFPGPVTPRDFITLLITSDNSLTEKSAATLESGEKHVPRNFMILSRPVNHPDAPERPGHVRGQYESVELIREIPLNVASKSASKSTLDLPSKKHDSGASQRNSGSTHSLAESRDDAAKDEETNGADDTDPEAELNPVEWIMISRSDPGGGIPRFLIDRGTPDAMIQDIHKFFNWACAKDYIPTPDEQPPEKVEAPRGAHATADHDHPPPEYSASNANSGGIMSTIKGALESGAATVDAYTPAMVSNLLHTHILPERHAPSEDSSDTASVDSFLSASEMNRLSTAPEHPDALGSGSSLELPQELRGKDKKDMNSHERELVKIAEKQKKLDRELLKKRTVEEDKIRASQEKDDADATKFREKLDKDLKKAEEKHNKEMEKLQKRRDKELLKAEERRNKKNDQNKWSQLTRERDEFRSQADLFKHEIEILRRQVAELQLQNSRLVAQVKTPSGSTTTLPDTSPRASRSSTTTLQDASPRASRSSIAESVR